MRKLGMLGAVLVAFLQVGCPTKVEPGPRLQGVVVVLLDTLRADHLGCYGYERPTSPTIDAMARDGVRFTQVVSAAPWTLPSVCSFLAGRYAERVWEESLLTESLVERLRDAGIRTAAYTEGGFVSAHFGLDRGFEQFVEEEGPVQLLDPGETRDPGKPGGIERTFAQAEQWLSEVGDDRFFLMVHTYEPHMPYTNHDFAGGLPPGRIGPAYRLEDMESLQRLEFDLTASELEYITALYDGDILNSDRFVERLLNRLEALGLDESVAVVVTSDHGEELGDHYPHNTGNHGHALLDGQLLVPLVIRDPVGEYASHVVDHQVRLIDVMPTVADLLDVPLGETLDGRSLLSLMRGDENEERIALAGQVKRGPAHIAVRAMSHKYIRKIQVSRELPALTPEPPVEQLYDLRSDPGERDNIAAERRELIGTLDGFLIEGHPGLDRSVAPDDANEMNPELLERLKSLGYLN